MPQNNSGKKNKNGAGEAPAPEEVPETVAADETAGAAHEPAAPALGNSVAVNAATGAAAPALEEPAAPTMTQAAQMLNEAQQVVASVPSSSKAASKLLEQGEHAMTVARNSANGSPHQINALHEVVTNATGAMATAVNNNAKKAAPQQKGFFSRKYNNFKGWWGSRFGTKKAAPTKTADVAVSAPKQKGYLSKKYNNFKRWVSNKTNRLAPRAGQDNKRWFITRLLRLRIPKTKVAEVHETSPSKLTQVEAVTAAQLTAHGHSPNRTEIRLAAEQIHRDPGALAAAVEAILNKEEIVALIYASMNGKITFDENNKTSFKTQMLKIEKNSDHKVIALALNHCLGTTFCTKIRTAFGGDKKDFACSGDGATHLAIVKGIFDLLKK
jgi:hypothetical protein